MTARRDEKTAGAPRRHRWRAWLLGALAVAAALVLAYFVLAAFIPRWWAQRIADMSGHGSFARGLGSGLALGTLCTGLPLLLLLAAALFWRRRGGVFLAGAATLLAVLLALPNLMTLSIVLGTTDAAHAAERVLDVTAPGFRGATAIGAITAAVLVGCAAVAAVVHRYRARRHRRAAEAAAAAADDPGGG